MGPTVVVASSTVSYVVRFRRGLIQALQLKGYRVVVVAPEDSQVGALRSLGCAYEPVRLTGTGTAMSSELMAISDLFRVFRKVRPVLVLNYTPKLDIYGGLVARALAVPCINNLSGLGSAITRGGLLGLWVKSLLWVSQRSAAHIFVQNGDDWDFVISKGWVKPVRVSVLPGSGVDLDEFPFTPMGEGRPVCFLLIARMVGEKGITEFAEAARRVRRWIPEARFQLVGPSDPGNRYSIPASTIRGWEADGTLQWLGPVDDVRSLVAASDCVVLPSYREGTPRTLLEAAAMGRPIIAADSIGTREPVEDGVNGFLCRPRDADDLAVKMHAVATMSPEDRAAMGRRGRRLMERKYDVRFVVNNYLEVIERVLSERGRN
jgi:glycosyltransferase involved in cell wall biosynthesis